MVNSQLNLDELKKRARSGTPSDVDYLMEMLDESACFVTCKMVDFALGLVPAGDGVDRIRFYLLHGASIQRSYATLYFKRKGRTDVLDLALFLGCIDEIQAYSK